MGSTICEERGEESGGEEKEFVGDKMQHF